MEYIFLAAALTFGGVYVAVLIKGLQKNKRWAHEIALTIALMEPSRGYMDYSYLRHGPENADDVGPDADPDDPNEPDERSPSAIDRASDRLAA